MEDLRAYLSGLSDGALGAIVDLARDEIRRRALEAGDAEAWAEQGFVDGFDSSGWPALPWIAGPFLIAPGGKIPKGMNGHRCRFVCAEGEWVWNSPLLVTDAKQPRGKGGMCSVTVLAWHEGLELEVVDSKATGARHERQKVQRIVVVDGQLMIEDAAVSSAPETHW